MDNYIELELGSSFLLNAGIVGFIRALVFNNASEGKEYYYSEDKLYVSKEFLLNINIAQFYINAMVGNFRNTTKLIATLQKEAWIRAMHEKEIRTKEDNKKVSDYFKEFAAMLEKKSFIGGYAILEAEKINKPIAVEKITEFKKEKDVVKKYEKYFELCDLLSQDKVQEILIMKEIMYTRINLFYDNVSFYLPANVKKSMTDCYEKDFGIPFVKEIKTTDTKRKRCIECGNLSTQTKSLSFMIDSTDDVSRKKSYYWNLKPDAYVCPICAFIYTFVPIGFQFGGREGIFINCNDSVETLYRIMDSYRTCINDSMEHKISDKGKLYRVFSSNKIDMLKQKHSNLQVIVRGSSATHYAMNILSKVMIDKLIIGKKYLERLEKKYILLYKDTESVYDMVVDNILFHRNQYALIHKLFMRELQENRNVGYLYNILNLQILFMGGDRMDILQKRVNVSYMKGIELREALTQAIQDKEKDNNLRGLVYRLANAVSVGNRDMFLDSIIRVYSGKGIPMPAIFKEVFQSEDDFKAIGHGFILGLKYQKYEKQETEERREKQEDR